MRGGKSRLAEVTALHFPIIKAGGFLAINIADILAFPDPAMPRIQADNITNKKVKITREQVLAAQQVHPSFNRYQLADLLGCSEQTVDRRLKNNNIRGGKYSVQRQVKVVGGLVEEWASRAGFYLYDRRELGKNSCWVNSQWYSMSYCSVYGFSYIYIFWKPGITTIDRNRLSKSEWSEWGSRGVWHLPSVRSHAEHEAQFPVELPRRVIRLLSQPDDLVLDCFIGSGTTAVAAIQERRRYLGFDVTPSYAVQAIKRCSETQVSLGDFRP